MSEERTALENRFPGGCASCSVLVLPGGGIVRKGEDGWEVQCATCHQLDQRAGSDDFDPEMIQLPPVPPSGCATAVPLRVLGLTRTCWKCGKDTVCLIGLYPDRPARGYVGLFTTGNEKTMALVQRLVQRQGRSELAVTIKSRYSRTMHNQQLSNGCRHCDALQGNFPVHEEADRRVASDGVDGLNTLLVAECPVLEWQSVVFDTGGGVIII